MRLFILLLATLFLSSPALCASDESEKFSLISDFVVSTRAAYTLKEGLKASPKSNEQDAYFKSRVVALPDEALVPLIAEAYRSRVTLAAARDVSAFYRSEVGRKLIATQVRNLGTAKPQYPLTASEMAAAQRFSNSPSALEFRRASSDPSFFSDLTRILTEYLLKNPS